MEKFIKSDKKSMIQRSELDEKIARLENAVVELKLDVKALRKKEDNLLSILMSMDDLVFIIGLDGTFNRYYYDPLKENVLPFPKNFIGKHFKNVFPLATTELFQRAINAVEAYNSTQQFDYSTQIGNREYWFNVRISPFSPSSGGFFGYICVSREINERKHLEDALRESEESYRAVVQQSSECIFLADTDTRVILEGNKGLQRLLGYSPDEMIGMSLYDFMAHEQEDIYQKIHQILQDRSYFIGERKLRRKDGTFVDVEISVNLISYKGKEVFCVFARDIAPRKLAEEQLIHTATHDPLTGLVNRLLLYDRLARELTRARRYNKMIALIYLDLDQFKKINDTLGHSVGDHLLKVVGVRLRSILRESDTLARMGGDEYMFILPDIVKEPDISHIVENILHSIRKPFEIEGHEINITASIGVSIFPNDGENLDSLIKVADIAMYQAKSQGRDNFKRYSSEKVEKKHSS